jgi:hypothetical protein
MTADSQRAEIAESPEIRGDSKGVDPKPVKDKSSSKSRQLANLKRGNTVNCGRPKGLAQLARAATKDGADLISFFIRVLKHGKKESDRIKAGEWLADRGFGKSVDIVQMQNPDGTGMFQGVAEAASTRDIRAELIRRGALTETGRLVPTEN